MFTAGTNSSWIETFVHTIHGRYSTTFTSKAGSI
jgi:hypothetical protein